MAYLIENKKTVFTMSSKSPLYVYSQTDGLLMQVTKENIAPKNSKIVDAFRNFLGDKFSIDRIYDKEQIQEITQDARNVIVNLSLAENCLIAGKDENEDLDGGYLISTYPDAISGEYYAPTISGLPNKVVDYFSNKFGRTDIDALQEEITLNQDASFQAEHQQLETIADYSQLPTFQKFDQQDFEQ